MPKISEKIIKKRFPQVKGGLLGGSPGLEPASVNLFLQEILEDVKAIEKRNDELESQFKMQSEGMRSERSASADPAVEMPADMVEASEELSRNLRKVENLEEFYKRMIHRGESEIESMKEEVREKAKEMLEEADARAQNLIREANARFEEKSREAVKMIEQSEDVRRKLLSIAKYIESAV